MGRSQIAYIYSACVLMSSLLCAQGVELADQAATNKPCVDITSDEPYGFPLTIECPFSVDAKLLAKAVEMAKSDAPSKIVNARAGHMSHPGWTPGVVFFYEPRRTNQQSVSSSLYVYFGDAEEKREPGKASCGRDLIRISSASLRSSLRVVTNEVFDVGGSDVAANVRCVKEEQGEIDGKPCISIIDVPPEKKVRTEIQSLLQSLDSDKYLDAGYNEEINTIAGKVYPGEREKEIIPEAMAGTAFVKIESDEELIEEEQETYDGEILLYSGDEALHRGRWTRSLQNSYIEYHADTGLIDIRTSDGKYSAKQASFCKVDGVWVKVCDAMVSY